MSIENSTKSMIIRERWHLSGNRKSRYISPPRNIGTHSFSLHTNHGHSSSSFLATESQRCLVVPKEKAKRLRWLKALELKFGDIGCHHRVCSRHFPGGDAQSHDPRLSLGKRFVSLKKWWTGRAKRAQRQEAARNLAFSEESPSSSGCTPAKDYKTEVSTNDDEAVVEEHSLLVAQVGE